LPVVARKRTFRDNVCREDCIPANELPGYNFAVRRIGVVTAVIHGANLISPPAFCHNL